MSLSSSGNYLLSRAAVAFKKQSGELFLAEGTKYHQRAFLQVCKYLVFCIALKFKITNKKALEFNSSAFIKFRQLLTFPGSHPPSIIDVKELNFRVRYGNGWILLAIITGFI